MRFSDRYCDQLRGNKPKTRDLQFLALDQIKKLDFAASERPTFAHYRRFVQTGTFQMV